MEELICQNNYILIHFISSGSFGNVYKVYNKQLKIHTALKIEKEHHVKDESLETEIKNLIQLTALNVHNIPLYYDSGYCDVDKKLYLEMALYDDDLKGFRENNILTKNELSSIMFELLFTLYQFRIIEFEHRDIKLANILYKMVNISRIYNINNNNIIINSLIQPIVADFNHSGFIKDKSQTLFSFIKTNFVLQDIKKMLSIFKRLIKITTNLSNNDLMEIKLYIDYIERNDDLSSQFLQNSLLILYNKFIN